MGDVPVISIFHLLVLVPAATGALFPRALMLALVAELALALWLLVKGVRMPVPPGSAQ